MLPINHGSYRQPINTQPAISVSVKSNCPSRVVNQSIIPLVSLWLVPWSIPRIDWKTKPRFLYRIEQRMTHWGDPAPQVGFPPLDVGTGLTTAVSFPITGTSIRHACVIGDAPQGGFGARAVVFVWAVPIHGTRAASLSVDGSGANGVGALGLAGGVVGAGGTGWISVVNEPPVPPIFLLFIRIFGFFGTGGAVAAIGGVG